MDINYERNEELRRLNYRFNEGCKSTISDPEVLREVVAQLNEMPLTPDGVGEFKASRQWAEEDMAYHDPFMEAHDRALPKPSTRLKNRLKRKRKK